MQFHQSLEPKAVDFALKELYKANDTDRSTLRYPRKKPEASIKNKRQHHRQCIQYIKTEGSINRGTPL
jgi:hypothetical protein